MKTKEFIKKVEELGFEVGINSGTAYILNDKAKTAKVEIDKAFAIDCFFCSNWTLEEEIREKLFDLIVEYAATPVKDRGEEKKFYLKHRWLNLDTDNYLHLDVDDGSCMLDDNEKFSYTKIKLTEKEIEEIKEKFNTDLADFELVEVVEEIEK